jgi:hypothetical protein
MAITQFHVQRFSLTSSKSFGEIVNATNMATTPFTLVGNSADSSKPLLRPSPATGHEAEILDV